LAVETQRTGSRAGTGSELALKMLWWKRGFGPKLTQVWLLNEQPQRVKMVML